MEGRRPPTVFRINIRTSFSIDQAGMDVGAETVFKNANEEIVKRTIQDALPCEGCFTE